MNPLTSVNRFTFWKYPVPEWMTNSRKPMAAGMANMPNEIFYQSKLVDGSGTHRACVIGRLGVSVFRTKMSRWSIEMPPTEWKTVVLIEDIRLAHAIHEPISRTYPEALLELVFSDELKLCATSIQRLPISSRHVFRILMCEHLGRPQST